MLKPAALPILLLAALLLGACQPPATPLPAQPTPTQGIPTPTRLSASALPSASLAPPAPPSQTPPPAPRLCAPLPEVAMAQLPGLVSNPYHPPQPGSDEPHTGIDLAMMLPGSQVAVEGHPVAAALAGTVAMVTGDRFPFGNAVIIETPLQRFPDQWWAGASLPAPLAGAAPPTNLTCPAAPGPSFAAPEQRSLYLLYAHLREPAALAPGQEVSCGQALGAVGMSGNALNPHLHFEARVGPAGLRLDSMAHYAADASPAEMSHYCLWTVSGQFQLVDPLKVLALPPQ